MRQDSYFVVATLLLALDIPLEADAVEYQAEVDLGNENSEFLQMIFKQVEMLGNQNQNETKELLKTHTQVASALLKVAPVITIKGNITDPARSLTITFTVHASSDNRALDLLLYNDHRKPEVHQERQWSGRGGGGLLSPIVDFMEPYVLGFAELVVHSIFSNAISTFLEGATLSGDVRIV